MTELGRPLRILFAAPAFWPATAFGGPIPVMRELAAGLAENGCTIDVVTTSLTSPRGPRSHRTRVEEHDGATILYLATPVNYRWMGFTPSAPLWLERRRRPDIVHVFGFRDPLGAAVAAWCRLRGVPYILEGLGMFRPKLRKVGLKRVLDATAFRPLVSGASLLVAVSTRERDEYLEAGINASRIAVRPNGFPPITETYSDGVAVPPELPADAPLVLAVGRIAAGKGLELLVDALPGLPTAHLVLVGPDDGHGLSSELRRRARVAGVEDRLHLLGARSRRQIERWYAAADVLVLASRHESFGMVAAEAASAGLPVVVTNRCGVAELLHHAALVVPYDGAAIAAAVRRVLAEPGLSEKLAREGRETARRYAWPAIVSEQKRIYRHVLGERPQAPARH